MHDKKKADLDTNRQTEMEELSPEWHTSGCIIHEGKAHLVTVHIALLIMQPRIYAQVQANAHERDAATATTASNRLLMERIACDLRRWATDDPAFVETSTSLWQCSISIAVRAQLGHLSVTKNNFSDYIEKVMEHVLPARRSIPPTFLLVTDINPPELFVTKASAHFAQFAGDWVHSQVVSNADLTRLYNKVAEEFPTDPKAVSAAETLKSVENPKPLEPNKSMSRQSELGKHLIDSLESGVLHPSITFSGSATPPRRRSNTKKQDRTDKGNDRNG